MVRTPIAIALALATGGCAEALTPARQLVHTLYEECRPEGPSTRLLGVSPEGRFSLEGTLTDPERVTQCIERTVGARLR